MKECKKRKNLKTYEYNNYKNIDETYKKNDNIYKILLKEGINYIENENNKIIKNDMYIYTLFFNHIKEDKNKTIIYNEEKCEKEKRKKLHNTLLYLSTIEHKRNSYNIPIYISHKYKKTKYLFLKHKIFKKRKKKNNNKIKNKIKQEKRQINNVLNYILPLNQMKKTNIDLNFFTNKSVEYNSFTKLFFNNYDKDNYIIYNKNVCKKFIHSQMISAALHSSTRTASVDHMNGNICDHINDNIGSHYSKDNISTKNYEPFYKKRKNIKNDKKISKQTINREGRKVSPLEINKNDILNNSKDKKKLDHLKDYLFCENEDNIFHEAKSMEYSTLNSFHQNGKDKKQKIKKNKIINKNNICDMNISSSKDNIRLIERIKNDNKYYTSNNMLSYQYNNVPFISHICQYKSEESEKTNSQNDINKNDYHYNDNYYNVLRNEKRNRKNKKDKKNDIIRNYKNAYTQTDFIDKEKCVNISNEKNIMIKNKINIHNNIKKNVNMTGELKNIENNAYIKNIYNNKNVFQKKTEKYISSNEDNNSFSKQNESSISNEKYNFINTTCMYDKYQEQFSRLVKTPHNKKKHPKVKIKNDNMQNDNMQNDNMQNDNMQNNNIQNNKIYNNNVNNHNSYDYNYYNNVYGFGETLKFMKYRELLRKYMGTFYNYSSLKCASYIIIYSLIVKIITQISKNITTSNLSSDTNDMNLINGNKLNTNLFLNIYDADGIIQSICYIVLLICIILLIKLGIPSTYLLAGRLTILFMFLFVIQIPIMIYANFLFLKQESTNVNNMNNMNNMKNNDNMNNMNNMNNNDNINNNNNNNYYYYYKMGVKYIYDRKKDYFNLQLQKLWSIFYIDTMNLLIYTILITFVSLYATYHKLIYPHLLKFYLDHFFLSSYSIVKKEIIHFRVPNNIDAYYLNKMNSYLFNTLYKKQQYGYKENIESTTRRAIGYNIVIKKEKCSFFFNLFTKNVSNKIFRLRNDNKNLNFYIIFYIGELDKKGRPHGFGYWRGINLEGEVLIGYWYHGIPVGPFKCRDFKTGSGFMCIKIGYGKTNCELNDLEIGLADTECCVSGAFYRTFPRVIFYNLNLTNNNSKNRKNESNHGIFEKRECCEYLIINKASNDILRVDYNKLLSDEEEEKQEEKHNEQNENTIDNDKYDIYDNNNINNINNHDHHLSVKHPNDTQKENKIHDNKEIILNIPSNYKRDDVCPSPFLNDDICPSPFLNDDILLKKDILNYDDICDLSYSIQNEIHSTFNKNIETNNTNINIYENKSWLTNNISYNNSFDKDNTNFLCDMNIAIKKDKQNISISSNDDTDENNLTNLPTNKLSSHEKKKNFLNVSKITSHNNMNKLNDNIKDISFKPILKNKNELIKIEEVKEHGLLYEQGSFNSQQNETSHKNVKGKKKKNIYVHKEGLFSKPKMIKYSKEKIIGQNKIDDEEQESKDKHRNSSKKKLYNIIKRKISTKNKKKQILNIGKKKDNAYINEPEISKRKDVDMNLLRSSYEEDQYRRRRKKKKKKIKNKDKENSITSRNNEMQQNEYDHNYDKEENEDDEESLGILYNKLVKENIHENNNYNDDLKDDTRKIKKHIGYSMTNNILDFKRFRGFKRRKKKTKKKKKSHDDINMKSYGNSKDNNNDNNNNNNKYNKYFHFNKIYKIKNNRRRRAFLPKALSGTLPKLKRKKKGRRLLFSDTITNVYQTKCMNIILQNLCPHMPNFGIIYNTDLHISIDAERGLYITGYINKKNYNFLTSRNTKDNFEDNEVKIKIIKKRKNINNNTFNHNKYNDKHIYSWIDDIKELSLDGWVKCELAGCLEAVIFIHGYNTSHLEALQILGQMASFGNFPNYIKLFLFNWPSGKNLLEFFIAKDNSQNKKVHHAFKSFLDTLRNNGIRQIHIITHSMGTRMFLLAFHDIVSSDLFSTIEEKEKDEKYQNKMKLITLTMMNPEYYLSDFVNKEYIFLRSFCTVISIYCDSNDKALKWAEIFSGTKSLGKNVFDLNINKEDISKKYNGQGANYLFDSNQLDYYSIPMENNNKIHNKKYMNIQKNTNDKIDYNIDHNIISSFFDCENLEITNNKKKKSKFKISIAEKLRTLVYFFFGKKYIKNKTYMNEHNSLQKNDNDNDDDDEDICSLNKDKTQNILHQPPMFRNTLLVFTGIEPTYCYKDNRDWLDVDVIDTTWLGSNVHTLRHSYWSLNREIIEDIRELIVTRKRARQRTSRLDRREGNVWVYRVAPSHLKSIFDSDI
ncbi:conserved Plasmodium membrane protein, unknown function [Plasmodium sp. DRC-Itaito]|nr:conserved Plasmodium membrane protein, unknown function [Plasmodium sp. DRC-Itaito]